MYLCIWFYEGSRTSKEELLVAPVQTCTTFSFRSRAIDAPQPDVAQA